MPSNKNLQFYRYHWREYAVLDYDGEDVRPPDPNPKLELIPYQLIKETDKGYWIGFEHSIYKKWVSKTSKKRFAYPTKEEALKNFILRTKRRVEILKHQIVCSEIALDLAEKKII